MLVTVDHGKCQGHGLCHLMHPDLFPLDDLGYSALRDAEVAEADQVRAQRAVASCPERALSARS
jgi:ferredoxin